MVWLFASYVLSYHCLWLIIIWLWLMRKMSNREIDELKNIITSIPVLKTNLSQVMRQMNPKTIAINAN